MLLTYKIEGVSIIKLSILIISVLSIFAERRGFVMHHRSQHSPLKDGRSLDWCFKHLTHSYRMACEAVFREYGLTEYGQPMILFVLKDMGADNRAVTQKELSEYIGVSQTTTAVSLKSLERQGCIRRRSDKRDLRRKYVEITGKGLEVAGCFKQAFEHIHTVMYKDFSPEEKEEACRLFKRMSINLMKIAKPDCKWIGAKQSADEDTEGSKPD